MKTLASASLSREHLEYRANMVGPLTVLSVGLGLATLTTSHRDSDARCSPRAQDLALTLLGDRQSLATRPQHTHLESVRH